MLLVAVVGDRESGKTTFLGLLYATLVRSGSDKEDALRFHAAYDSLEEIAGLYQRLMSGAFPDTATKEGIRGLRLELGFPRPKRGLLPRLGPLKLPADATTSVRFSLPGSLDEGTPGLHQGSTFGTGLWRDALDADALVFLVDCTRLAPKSEDPMPGPMAAYDDRIDSLLASIRRWRSRGGREVLHPIFVLSKFDALPAHVRKAADLDANPPDVSEAGPRAAYARALLKPNLPRTLATLAEAAKGRPRFAAAAYVFSSVRTDTDASKRTERIKLRRIRGAAWEPDYARDEYLAFVNRLADIAGRTKD